MNDKQYQELKNFDCRIEKTIATLTSTVNSIKNSLNNLNYQKNLIIKNNGIEITPLNFDTLDFLGGNAFSSGHTVKVTFPNGSGGSILDYSVTNTKLALTPALTLKGNRFVANSEVQDLTVPEIKNLLSYTKSDIGLGAVDNTSDLNKPLSNADIAALAAKAPLNSPVFVGTPTAPTPLEGDNSTKLATTAFVFTAIEDLVAGSVPDATDSVKGKLKLAGDLGGTADLPTVPELANKQATLVSGTNIKTINGTSLLGSGNLVITGGETNTASNVGIVGVGIFKQKTGVDLEFKKLNAGSNKVTITDDVGNNEIDVDVVVANLTGIAQSQVTNLTTDLSNKQETLVSGTNIKTINSTSLLGSGDISIDLSVKQTNIQFQNKGVSLGTSGTVDVINFTGAAINASRSGNTLTVDVSATSGVTNLGYTASSTNGIVTSDTGTDATIPLVTGTDAGLLAPADFTKLGYITITQAVDLDQLESDNITNNAKVSNATHTGDVTGSGVLTLATVNSNVGTFGSSTQVPQFVVNGKGLITSVSNVNITPAASSITGVGNITKVDDVNVTLTLGGTPVGSVLNGVSFTLGWTGTLADGRIASASNWNSAYTNRITSLTTTGNSGASTLISNVLNIPTYTLAGLGGISLTSLSSTAIGLTYTDTTGVFSLTSGYVIPTTTQETNWNTAYTNRITSLTTTGSSGAATLVSNVLNIPNYTLAGLGGQPLDADLTAIAALAGTSGFLKTNGAGVWTVDTNTYLTGNQSITLSGEASGSGTTGISVTLSNSAVISKVLTGFTSTTGTILATDSILQAIQKLDGNLAAATAGGVSSVTGTTNRITSTGGSNPIIDISASYVGQSSITTLGTISTGVWQGTVVDELYGGTGISTYTTGDILYSSATNTLAKLPISTNGKVLTITAGIPSWETPTSGVTDHTALSNLVWASSSHTGTASRIAGFNGSGVASYYQIGVDLQGYDTTLNALASYNTNGILTQTGADTFVGRSLQGTTNRITLTNGDGVLGNPTIDISSNYVGQSSITTLGTITTGVWNGTAIGDSYISSAFTWNNKQAAYTNLTSIGTLANSAGVLTNNGSGTFSYTTVTSNATHTGDATGATALTVVGINGTLLSGLATGILKNTTGTGVPSIAVAGDFPTLNQNTTGSAATLTTGRTISITGDLAYTSPSFDGSGNVTAAGTLATVNSNVGSFGSSTQVGTFTVNAKGLITAASNVTITPAASNITGGAALTKVDDTNVTLTLGGTPATSLLQPVSIAVGWSGTLADSRITSASTWNSKQSGIQFKDAGVNLGTSATVTEINFTGNGISASRVGNVVTVDVGATSGVTNLTYTASATNGIVVSDTGSDATIPAADGTNAGLMIPAQFNKLGFVTITQAVDLDTLESNVATNNAKVTNATHTGDATGSTALTVVGLNGTLLSGLGTGLLKNTTGTGIPSIAVQSDITSLLGTGSITNAMLANTAVANLSGTNSGDNAVNSLYSGLITNATHTGDVTGATTLTIATNIVTNAKLAQMPANTFKGNNTGSTANATDLTVPQMQAELSVDDLVTLSGVADGAVNLGTFSGVTIPDNSTIKAAFQSIETTLETNYTVTNRQNKIRVVSINTTLSTTTDGTVVFDTAGTVATLPSPTNELMLVVKNVSNGSITVTGHLDGVAAQTFTVASLESFRFHSNGSTYYIIA